MKKFRELLPRTRSSKVNFCKDQYGKRYRKTKDFFFSKRTVNARRRFQSSFGMINESTGQIVVED